MNNMTCDISVVIPTYNEVDSIENLIREIDKHFQGSGVKLEYVVVDDNSPDGTAEKASSLKGEYNVNVIVRKNERGLATAAVRGFHEAKGRLLAVIDGDFQHPPEVIFHLFSGINEHRADMALASRKVAGGGTQNWEFYRVIISTVATGIAKFLMPITLFKVGDATTGCFMFKKENVDLSKLSPVGFKIFLEVLTFGKFSKRIEVPYIFNQRSKGISKMSVWQDILFLLHLVRLGWSTGEIAIPILVLGALSALFFTVLW